MQAPSSGPALPGHLLPHAGEGLPRISNWHAQNRNPGEETSNRPAGGEIVDGVDEPARGEQRDDLRRRLQGGLSF